VSTSTKDSYYWIFLQTIWQLEPATSDIAVGCLTLHSGSIHVAEAPIPYIYINISWYVPCPKPATRWKFVYKIFGSLVLAFFRAVAVLAVITMWLLAKYERQLHVRESTNNQRKMYCIYNVWTIITGVYVPQKPISISLRIFFTAWVWYAVAMTTVYQAFFFGLLVNPGFENSITTLKGLIQSGIVYGYPVEMDALALLDRPYEIFLANRKTCKSISKCLQRVIEHRGFATIFESFHAEYSELDYYSIKFT